MGIPLSAEDAAMRGISDTVFSVALELAQKDAERVFRIKQYEEKIMRLMYSPSGAPYIPPPTSTSQSEVPSASKPPTAKKKKPSFLPASVSAAPSVHQASSSSKEPNESGIKPIKMSRNSPQNAGPKGTRGALKIQYDPFVKLRRKPHDKGHEPERETEKENDQFVVDPHGAASFDAMESRLDKLGNQSALQRYLKTLEKRKKLPGAIVRTPTKSTGNSSVNVSSMSVQEHREMITSYRASPSELDEKEQERAGSHKMRFVVKSISAFLQKREQQQPQLAVPDESFSAMLVPSTPNVKPPTPKPELTKVVESAVQTEEDLERERKEKEAAAQAEEERQRRRQEREIKEKERQRIMKKKIREQLSREEQEEEELLRVLEQIEREEEAIFKRIMAKYSAAEVDASRAEEHAQARNPKDALRILDLNAEEIARATFATTPDIQISNPLNVPKSYDLPMVTDLDCAPRVFAFRDEYAQWMHETRDVYQDAPISTAETLDLITAEVVQDVVAGCMQEASLILDAFVVQLMRGEFTAPDALPPATVQVDM
jgi:hypothetical protein